MLPQTATQRTTSATAKLERMLLYYMRAPQWRLAEKTRFKARLTAGLNKVNQQLVRMR